MSNLRARLRSHGPLWRNGDFLRLWSAQTISQFGSQMTQLALPLVAILELKASTFEVALLGVLEFLPWLLFALPAGVWVDRLRRRPILVATDLGRAAVLASIPLAYLLDLLALGQLYVVAFITGILWVFFDIAYQSYLPSLVERSEIGDANTKLEISRSSAQVAGPGLAGVLVSAITAPYAILVDAMSFVGSAVLLMRIKRAESATELRGAAQPQMRTEIVEGLRFVLRHPILRPYMAFIAMSNLFASMLFAIFLVYAVRVLHLSTQTIGVIFALGNVGSLIGALSANRMARAFGIGPTLIGVGAVAGFGLMLIPLADGPVAIPFLVIANMLYGLFIFVVGVLAISLIQAVTPSRLLGRTTASRRLVIWGVIPAGSLIGGALGSTIGLRDTIWIAAIGASVAVLWLLFSPMRAVKRTEDADEIVRSFNEEFALKGQIAP